MFIVSCAQFGALAVVVALYTGFQSETSAQQVTFVKISLTEWMIALAGMVECFKAMYYDLVASWYSLTTLLNRLSINGDFFSFFYFWPQNYHYNIEQVIEKSWRCKKMKFWSKFVLCTWTILQKLGISSPKMMLKGSLLIVLWQHIVIS